VVEVDGEGSAWLLHVDAFDQRVFEEKVGRGEQAGGDGPFGRTGVFHCHRSRRDAPLSAENSLQDLHRLLVKQRVLQFRNISVEDLPRELVSISLDKVITNLLWPVRKLPVCKGRDGTAPEDAATAQVEALAAVVHRAGKVIVVLDAESLPERPYVLLEFPDQQTPREVPDLSGKQQGAGLEDENTLAFVCKGCCDRAAAHSRTHHNDVIYFALVSVAFEERFGNRAMLGDEILPCWSHAGCFVSDASLVR
jgi:hypothetical protein